MMEHITMHENCYIDINRAILMKNGLPYSLTPIETKLLQSLASNHGHIVMYDQLLNDISTYRPDMTRHELHVYMSRLRKKFDSKLSNKQNIISIKGIGYLLPSMDQTN